VTLPTGNLYPNHLKMRTVDPYMRCYAEKFNMLIDQKQIEVTEFLNRENRKLKTRMKELETELKDYRKDAIFRALEDAP